MCLCLGDIHVLCLGAQGAQKMVLGPLELELQGVGG